MSDNWIPMDEYLAKNPGVRLGADIGVVNTDQQAVRIMRALNEHMECELAVTKSADGRVSVYCREHCHSYNFQPDGHSK